MSLIRQPLLVPNRAGGRRIPAKVASGGEQLASGEEGVFEGGHLVIELQVIDLPGQLADAWAGLDAEGEEVATEEERRGRGDFDVERFDTRAEPGDGGGGSEAGRLDAGEESRLDGQREASELAVGDGGTRLLLFVPAGGEAAVGVESEDLSSDVKLRESLQPEALEKGSWIGRRAAEEREHDGDALRVGEIVDLGPAGVESRSEPGQLVGVSMGQQLRPESIEDAEVRGGVQSDRGGLRLEEPLLDLAPDAFGGEVGEVDRAAEGDRRRLDGEGEAGGKLDQAEDAQAVFDKGRRVDDPE